jgi:hypothetical protein
MLMPQQQLVIENRQDYERKLLLLLCDYNFRDAPHLLFA